MKYRNLTIEFLEYWDHHGKDFNSLYWLGFKGIEYYEIGSKSQSQIKYNRGITYWLKKFGMKNTQYHMQYKIDKNWKINNNI